MEAGYIAAGTFLLFTGTGAIAQVIKLTKRTAHWRAGNLERDRVCDGLHPVREFWSYSAFLLFALSGATRSYVDLFLLVSRTPVVLLSTVIMGFLAFHEIRSARKFLYFALVGDLVLFLAIVVLLCGYSIAIPWLAYGVDIALAGISFFLFYGKSLQAYTMWKEKRTMAVSWTREIGLVLKDISGLWYTVTIGSALFFVGLTHVLSMVSSSSICWVKWRRERVE